MTNRKNHPHVLPLGMYLTVGTTLLTLTATTVWVASYDLGSLNLVVAMIIAAVKGTLVALYFMHLRYDNKMYSLIFGTALLFLAIFIIITMFDTLRRDDIYDFRSTPVSDRAEIYSITGSSVGNDSTVATDSVSVDSVNPANVDSSVIDSAGR